MKQDRKILQSIVWNVGSGSDFKSQNDIAVTYYLEWKKRTCERAIDDREGMEDEKVQDERKIVGSPLLSGFKTKSIVGSPLL